MCTFELLPCLQRRRIHTYTYIHAPDQQQHENVRTHKTQAPHRHTRHTRCDDDDNDDGTLGHNGPPTQTAPTPPPTPPPPLTYAQTLHSAAVYTHSTRRHAIIQAGEGRLAGATARAFGSSQAPNVGEGFGGVMRTLPNPHTNTHTQHFRDVVIANGACRCSSHILYIACSTIYVGLLSKTGYATTGTQ